MAKFNIFLIVILLLLIIKVEAQPFEGEVIYENSYTSKIPSISSEELSNMMGTTYEYYIKNDKYKSVTNGNFAQMQVYIPSENRLYSKLSVSDTLHWSDGNNNMDEAISYEIKKNQAEILGYKCNALIVLTKTGKSTYYFSKKIKVDPELYKNHRYGNWNLIMAQTKSLPLKIETEKPQFTMVSTAVEITEMELEDSFFILPNVPIKKSPY